MQSIQLVECPFCREDIKEGALKCKHCGSMFASEKEPMAESLAVPPPRSGSGKLRKKKIKLKKANPVVVFLLCLVTLTLYGPYWVGKRADELAQQLETDIRVPPALLGAYWLAAGLVAVDRILELIGQPLPQFVSHILPYSAWLLMLLALRRLHGMMLQHRGEPKPLAARWSNLWLFFFGIAALQYRINRFQG